MNARPLPAATTSRRHAPRALLLPMLVALLACAGPSAHRLAAQGTATETFSYTPNLPIPDNSTVGVSSTQTVSSALVTITGLVVTLDVTGGFNGDYYAYLVHNTGPGGTGFAVLLNRVGRTGINAFGYSDNGFSSVRFNDNPLATTSGDIHNYQTASNPNGSALSGGLWQSDGRNVNPNSAVDTSPRGAFLTSFNGLDPNGTWTLYIADLSAVGNGTFTGWGLEITGMVVPEPGSGLLALLAAGACGVAVPAWRRRAARKK